MDGTATAVSNVSVDNNVNGKVPSGGTWAFLAVADDGDPYAGTVSGGSNIGHTGSFIAIRKS